MNIFLALNCNNQSINQSIKQASKQKSKNQSEPHTEINGTHPLNYMYADSIFNKFRSSVPDTSSPFPLPLAIFPKPIRRCVQDEVLSASTGEKVIVI
jgi:hypothetical protein